MAVKSQENTWGQILAEHIMGCKRWSW